ncbi:unnamed protein product [Clonostachys rosea]|uniref:RTA1 domain protein n=1 Tax=Bionectria ochroleuca TaxID=29856 RepID=A0ABY6TZT5_BIOOC|nr:unnamed protein product [Clonostachys rosea]
MTITYQLGGNSFFLAANALLLFPQVFFGLKHRTWGFSFGILSGLILEVIAYTGRILIHEGNDQAVMQLVCVTIGPAFVSAAIYLCLARIIAVYGEHVSWLRPRTITIIFMLSDFFALVLQAGGGALIAGETNSIDTRNTALAILKAGLGVHLGAMGIYVILSCQVAYSVYNKPSAWNPQFSSLQSSPRFKAFMGGLALATLCILVRTAYRVAELSQGFGSPLAQNETAFFILESTLVLVACIALSVIHPGVAFQGRWPDADFQLVGKRKTEYDNKDGVDLSSSGTV